jgi:hypothetical protein
VNPADVPAIWWSGSVVGKTGYLAGLLASPALLDEPTNHLDP